MFRFSVLVCLNTWASVVLGNDVYNFTILSAKLLVRSRRSNIRGKAEEGRMKREV